MSLRINNEAPNFTAETTEGTITFHDWIGDGWAILFSHPKGCPARCAGPAAPPWRPFSRCMVSASRRHAGISGLNATRLVWL